MLGKSRRSPGFAVWCFLGKLESTGVWGSGFAVWCFHLRVESLSVCVCQVLERFDVGPNDSVSEVHDACHQTGAVNKVGRDRTAAYRSLEANDSPH